MAEETLIQWCDRTWSPWLGCRKVSPGCDNCYITGTIPFRVGGIRHGGQREELSDAYWSQPMAWNKRAAKDSTKPRVFPSLCDPFDTETPFEIFTEFMSLVLITQNLTWLLLTKRPQNVNPLMERFCATLPGVKWDGFGDNVWLGVSCENQEWANKRIPILLSIPAKVRFLSVEPMLGPVDLSELLIDYTGEFGNGGKWRKIDWVIVGGESGPGARPCSVDWIRSIVDQCKATAVPVFVKQLGSAPYRGDARGNPVVLMDTLKHSKGGDMAEWPEYLRVREFPAL